MSGERTRISSVWYFILSFIIRWVYNLLIFVYHGFSGTEKTIIHALLAAVSCLLAWMALQLFKKSSPSGSNAGCFYLILLYLNFVGGLGALFFSLVQFFSEEGGAETLWLL